MQNKKPKKQLYLLLSSLFLLTLACRVEAPRIILEESPTAPPPPIITQVVTEVITPTPAPTSTPQPTSTPEITATSTYDPLSAPIYYPLEGCAASRLHMGDYAMVSLVGGANGIRSGLDLQSEIVEYYAQPGEILKIVGGPFCSYGWIVWLVETGSAYRGFTPEGNGEEYWLFPSKP
jgi:hypothetical protein